MLGVGTSALGNLQDQGSTLFDSGFGDALDDFHVVYVESADGVAAFVSLLEHLFGINECHFLIRFSGEWILLSAFSFAGRKRIILRQLQPDVLPYYCTPKCKINQEFFITLMLF